MNNIIESPFNPQFGKRPDSFVGREDIVDGLLREYYNQNAPERVTIISGVRGSGKTSILSDISTVLEESIDWIVVNVATTDRLLDNLIGILEHKLNHQIYSKLPSVKGVTVGTPFGSIEFGKPEMPTSTVFYPRLLALMEEIRQRELKMIFVIDEVHSTSEMREFVSTYQLLIRENYDIVLLMAGLPHYVDAILNDKILTFLKRANHIFLSFIEPFIFKLEYERIFKVAGRAFLEEALDIAYISTGGYPYLYQLIGYFLWRMDENEIDVQTVKIAVEQSKGMLFQNVYSIIFSELSRVEQDFLQAMRLEGLISEVQKIRERMGKNPSYVNSYREKLTKKGLIQSVSHGVIRFSLPFFGEYLAEQAKRM